MVYCISNLACIRTRFADTIGRIRSDASIESHVSVLPYSRASQGPGAENIVPTSDNPGVKCSRVAKVEQPALLRKQYLEHRTRAVHVSQGMELPECICSPKRPNCTAETAWKSDWVYKYEYGVRDLQDAATRYYNCSEVLTRTDPSLPMRFLQNNDIDCLCDALIES